MFRQGIVTPLGLIRKRYEPSFAGERLFPSSGSKRSHDRPPKRSRGPEEVKEQLATKEDLHSLTWRFLGLLRLQSALILGAPISC